MIEIYKRVSTRQFSDKQVSIDYIMMLLRAGMQAPSACNQQPWDFLVINDKDTLKKLLGVSSYTEPLETAKVAIVLLSRSDDQLKLPMCKVQDLSACTQNILLKATNLNIGAFWLALEPFESRKKFVKDVLNLPDTVEAFNIICLGYPKEQQDATSRFDETRIHFNEFKKYSSFCD